MRKILALLMGLILSFSLFVAPTYATEISGPTLKQPKLSAEYTGLQVSLSINPNGNSAGHWYIIERSSSPDMSSDYKLVQDWSLSLVSADTVTPDTIYYYRTKLKNIKGEESVWSDTISIRTIISSEPKKDPSEKTQRELLLDKIADMSLNEKVSYMAAVFNNMPYTVDSSEKDTCIKTAINSSTISSYEKSVLTLEPDLLDRLGSPDYKIFDTPPLGKVPTFTDMPQTHWAYEAAKSLCYAHVVTGFEDGSYRPNDTVTLAQALVFLDRTVKNHPYTKMNWPRTEVEKMLPKTDYWAYPHIASIASKVDAKTLPLINPTSYNNPITKEILAQLIYALTNQKLPAVTTSGNYRDIHTTSYPQALRYCLRAGLLQGTTPSYIKPKDTLTRGELTVILSRLNELLLQELDRLDKLSSSSI